MLNSEDDALHVGRGLPSASTKMAWENFPAELSMTTSFPLRRGRILGDSIVLDILIIWSTGSERICSWCVSWPISFHTCVCFRIITLPCYLPYYSSGLSWCVIVYLTMASDNILRNAPSVKKHCTSVGFLVNVAWYYWFSGKSCFFLFKTLICWFTFDCFIVSVVSSVVVPSGLTNQWKVLRLCHLSPSGTGYPMSRTRHVTPSDDKIG
jgi:hypothetical protein